MFIGFVLLVFVILEDKERRISGLINVLEFMLLLFICVIE